MVVVGVAVGVVVGGGTVVVVGMVVAVVVVIVIGSGRCLLSWFDGLWIGFQTVT